MATLIRLSTLLAFSVSIALTGAAAADSIKQHFNVEPGGQLVVEADGARLEVNGSTVDEVHVTITRSGDSAIEDDYDIDFTQQGDEVRVTLERHRRWWGWSSRSLVINIETPRRFDVDLETSGGRIVVEDINGTIEAISSGGGLHFESVDGPIYGRTSGGSIYLEGTSGDADLKTSGGSINIGEVDGKVQARTSGGKISIERGGDPVFAKTSGGSIEIGEALGAVQASTSGGHIRAGISAQPSADSKLTTSGGSVTVYLNPSIALNLDARASGGRVRSDLPITVQGDISKNRLEGDLNGGGPLLYLRSSGGSVNLRAL